jgi:heme oxygenase (biliverdin-IX-beta and delta-forming)
MSSSRQHAGPPSSSRPQVPEPSLAERARTLLHIARMGTLSTLSRKHPGFPFGSLMPYALDSSGRPIFLVSSMAMHTQNLHADSHASLFVTQPGVSGDPLGAARVTLMGRTAPAAPDARSFYLKWHENAQYWIDFDDFSLIHMEVEDVYFIGGFGVMGWIAAAEFGQAAPDPLADDGPRIIAHMNSDHADALLRITKVFGGAEADEARMISVDRLGFEVRLKTGDRVHGTRIAFLSEVKSVEDSRSMLIEMSRRSVPNP